MVVCRYLNSGIPVTIATRTHAFVLVGYGRSRDSDGNSQLHFIRHDDEVGPYRRVDNWKLDDLWAGNMLSFRFRKRSTYQERTPKRLQRRGSETSLARTPSQEATDLLARLDDPTRPLTFRSTVVLSNDFKDSP